MIRKSRTPPTLPLASPLASRDCFVLLLEADQAARAGFHNPAELRFETTIPLDDHNQLRARPLLVQAHAFGPDRPRHDIICAPGQSTEIDGARLALAGLVNGATVRRVEDRRLIWSPLVLDRDQPIDLSGLALHAQRLAEPAPSLDMLRALAVPVVSPITFELPDGPAALRHRLIGRAAPLGHTGTTDPDLHVQAVGIEIWPRYEDRMAYFDLPPGLSQLTLRTRSGVPSDFLGVNDHRHLGVAISRIQFGALEVAMTHWSLREGWHTPETSWRWMDGAAGLLVPSGAGLLEIEIANTLRRYPI
jgi:hypothetical protein